MAAVAPRPGLNTQLERKKGEERRGEGAGEEHRTYFLFDVYATSIHKIYYINYVADACCVISAGPAGCLSQCETS